MSPGLTFLVYSVILNNMVAFGYISGGNVIFFHNKSSVFLSYILVAGRRLRYNFVSFVW